jgi:hypothetical protein
LLPAAKVPAKALLQHSQQPWRTLQQQQATRAARRALLQLQVLV